MTCDFTSFSSVFQSYKDDAMVTMKGCVQWNLVHGWKDFRLKRYLNKNRKLSRPAINPYIYRDSKLRYRHDPLGRRA